MADVDTNQIATDVVSEKELQWSDLDGLQVFDENGATLNFGDLYKNQKTIIVFVRKANVRLAVIGCAKHTFIKNFRKVTGYQHDMYSDPQTTVYSKLGMIRTLSTGASGSEHVRSSVASGLANSLWRTMKSMSSQGDVKQQGGQLIVGPGNVLKYLHIDGGTFDHTPINKLLSMADVANVEFKKH
ncbi:Thioredoxin-like protein AAED1 [Trichoplax sp. H2]|nr:Thioredoxin-like protein AAED1 [Trichoplax sp. H2]|eukprot:RDD47937.1 Thioredoxin-like protein AAED1 [Trichoplax sp. H2]